MVKNPWFNTVRPASEIILVFEGEDCSLFASVDLAVRALEPIDARAGIFTVFRGDGSPGVLTVSGSDDPQFGTIELRFTPSDADTRADLARRVRSFLTSIGHARTVTADGVESGVAELRDRVGFTR